MHISIIEWDDDEWRVICDAAQVRSTEPEALVKAIVNYDLQSLPIEEAVQQVEAEKNRLIEAADAIRRRREQGED
jgi:hypothetical protein